MQFHPAKSYFSRRVKYSPHHLPYLTVRVNEGIY